MSAWEAPNPEWQSCQDAHHTERRETLAYALSRMETSLHRLRQVERHAAPIAQRLIRGHIQTLEQNIAQAEAEFLRAEPVRAVREAYQIIADWLKQHPPEEPTA